MKYAKNAKEIEQIGETRIRPMSDPVFPKLVFWQFLTKVTERWFIFPPQASARQARHMRTMSYHPLAFPPPSAQGPSESACNNHVLQQPVNEMTPKQSMIKIFKQLTHWFHQTSPSQGFRSDWGVLIDGAHTCASSLLASFIVWKVFSLWTGKIQLLLGSEAECWPGVALHGSGSRPDWNWSNKDQCPKKAQSD